jgi:hypothetical protein
MASRIGVDEARRSVSHGALLVCAYDDEARCRSAGLESALTLQEFQQRLPHLPKDQTIIFFCG